MTHGTTCVSQVPWWNEGRDARGGSVAPASRAPVARTGALSFPNVVEPTGPRRPQVQPMVGCAMQAMPGDSFTPATAAESNYDERHPSDMSAIEDSGTVSQDVTVAVAPTPPAYRVAKRGLDVVAAGIGLVVSSPVILGVAAAIRVSSPGPILFRQERLGLGGRPFTLYKFRSMHATADQAAHREYVRRLITGEASGEADGASGGADAGASTDERSTWVPIAGDPRVTRLGSFLRRSHVDELPQLLNVLRGEMSLVGPRPPIPYEVELYEPWHLERLSVIPGMTGLWQVSGWGRLSFDQGVRLDLEYVRRRSFGLDLRIILRTIWQILTRRQF
jgi:lipopolysaccharide/colanic/teichoic acid biosynthesis glycosyltransferase